MNGRPVTRRIATRRIITTSVVIAAAVGLVAGTHAVLDRLPTAAEPAAVESERSTSVAEVRSLTVDHEAAGTLIHEPSIAVTAPAAGTVLRVVEAGETLTQGDVITVIDDLPIVWFDGAVPAWRTMTNGDTGLDVAQLESALDGLGFNADGNVTIDDEFTTATATMVEAWQESIGAPVTGRVELGSAVFGDDRSRVAAVPVEVGDAVAADAELIALGTTRRIATFDVPAVDAVALAAGERVSIELPDRSTIDGQVAGIIRGADTWTITTIFGDVEVPDLDVVDVTMRWERTAAADVLTIPSDALLRLDGGHYVVDTIAQDVVTRRGVEIGPAVGTRVAIVAGLSPGDVVLTL